MRVVKLLLYNTGAVLDGYKFLHNVAECANYTVNNVVVVVVVVEIKGERLCQNVDC